MSVVTRKMTAWVMAVDVVGGVTFVAALLIVVRVHVSHFHLERRVCSVVCHLRKGGCDDDEVQVSWRK